jgi:hypothetical protein
VAQEAAAKLWAAGKAITSAFVETNKAIDRYLKYILNDEINALEAFHRLRR